MNQALFSLQVVSRDGCCQSCGSTEDLHAHHIVPRARGGKNELSNGQTLCSECHRAIHVGALAPASLNFRNQSGERHLTVPFTTEELNRIQFKATGNRQKMTKLGRAFFAAWLADDPDAIEVLKRFSTAEHSIGTAKRS